MHGSSENPGYMRKLHILDVLTTCSWASRCFHGANSLSEHSTESHTLLLSLLSSPSMQLVAVLCGEGRSCGPKPREQYMNTALDQMSNNIGLGNIAHQRVHGFT